MDKFWKWIKSSLLVAMGLNIALASATHAEESKFRNKTNKGFTVQLKAPNSDNRCHAWGETKEEAIEKAKKNNWYCRKNATVELVAEGCGTITTKTSSGTFTSTLDCKNGS